MFRTTATLALLATITSTTLADPCGMVPPIYVDDSTSLVRVGDQQTYVFHKDGLETFVIRPGFSGKVEDFGMLIPFPTPPGDPQGVRGHLRPRGGGDRSTRGGHRCATVETAIDS